ncbi:GLPGLI family protein [Flavobacterium sp.]|uniref:GLPGLI family protein n=1 Tax=Flavobacterium sp. TaxID=239 RepID=UPI003B9B4BB1
MFKAIILSIFFSFAVFSQSGNVSVIYSANIFSDKTMSTSHTELARMYDNALENAKFLTFTLEIVNNESYFYINPTDQKGMADSERQSIYPFLRYSGPVYCINEKVYRSSPLAGNNVYVSKVMDTNWTVTTETKKIENYLCYKATSTLSLDNGSQKYDFPIIAWFCPDLPFQHGPNGYGKLPGLILELHVRNAVFGATSIIAKEHKSVKPKNFDKATFMTYEEFIKSIREEMEGK